MSKVKDLRKEAGIKQSFMAKYLNISTTNYSKKEKGDVKYSLEEAKKVADYFKKTIEDIFFDNEVSKTETK